LEIREGRQSNPVADEVGALVAVTRPVIAGVLESISEEVVNTIGEPGLHSVRDRKTEAQQLISAGRGRWPSSHSLC